MDKIKQVIKENLQTAVIVVAALIAVIILAKVVL